ncbi:MAG: DUF547 domain-containing protein [Planctomycetota bacterium]|nr:MAG: DUF547 domain-containing protein [Planctomycetota bacterium]
MAKSVIVFTASLIILFLVVGCHPAKPKPAETQTVEQTTVEPPKPQPIEPKPDPAVAFHDKCADILTSYVNDSGMVDYKNLKYKKVKLKKLLDEFDNLDPNRYNAWPREDKIAFWINAYNTQMLNIIVENYPIESSRILRLFWPPNSIRHIKGIWSNHKFIVMDEEFTLIRLEHRFFRKEFDEPRVFFALCNASLSSPPLRNQPYYGHKLNQQLDDQVKRFLSSPSALEIDQNAKVVRLSAVLQPTWFGSEFISKYGIDKKFKDHPPAVRAVLNLITNYISKQDVRFLETENYTIEYIKYDWTLNE